MTLRTNLATRPFYNERVVQAGLLLLALLVALATGYNLVRLYTLTARESAVASEIRQAEARAQALQRDAAQARSGLDAGHVDAVSAAAREANRLIDQRVFSWTALFNQFEATLPAGVRVTDVIPGVGDQGRRIVTMTVIGRSVSAIDEFMEALEATGAFAGVLSREERETEDGMIEAQLRGYYDPSGAAAPVPPAPAAGRRGR